MFKRISCVALGAILTSLVSSVGPAYAMTLRGVNSSNSLGNQPSGLGDVDFGVDTPGLISQGTEVGDGGGDDDGLGIVIALAAFAALLALDGGDGNDEQIIIPDIPIDPNPDIPVDPNPDIPVDPNPDIPVDPPEAIPTPALLPGLVGMGMAAMRKRKLAQAD